MKIFIVNGTGGSGKTTFEKMVETIAEQEGYDIRIVSTIDYVKQMAKKFGWDGGKSLNDRRFLSDLKDALTRWKDVPYQKITKLLETLRLEQQVDVVFIDCREPEEIARFVKDYNAITILVQRGESITYGNHADDNVRNYQYDITIDNSRGLDELNQEAKLFVETWIGAEEN